MRLHEIAESTHTVLNPITLEKLVLVGERAGVGPGDRVLDLCCGKAEMLGQWAARFGCSGHGVDVSEVFLSAAADRVHELGVADRVTFTEADAEHFVTEERFDLVTCIGASWFGGDRLTSLKMMQGWAKVGATLLLGECFWSKPPTAEATAALGADFRTLPELFDEVATVGLEVVEMVASDGDGWDRYRARQWMNQSDWLLANPADPDAALVRQRMVSSRQRYVAFEREYLNWGVFVLRPRLGVESLGVESLG